MAVNALDRNERLNRITLLEERTNLLQKVRESGRRLSAQHKEQLIGDLKELVQLRRIHRGEADMLYFMYEYFSDAMNPENEQNLIPLGTRLEDAPDFHATLCGILDEVSNNDPTKRIAWAAPRGHAKSAYLSNALPVREIVYDKRRYILVISETDTSSKKFIEWVSLQLKFNKKLREDFGELLSPRKALNERDNQEAFLTENGILVEAASMGKQLRGKRNGAYRPDLVICDDLESARNTNTPELRDKNLHWFNSVVMPIGDPARTAIIYMGTLVHARGLLPTVLARADFESRTFAAIKSEPEREDLWTQFETMYRDPDNANRLDDAVAFYESHKEDMDQGVQTLWPSRFPYFKLIMEKVNIGSRAFGSEFMNNPVDEESQIFKPSMFTFFDYDDLVKLKGRLDYFMAWDIAMGKSDRSDYNAIVVVARDRKTGVIYVVDAWAAKCPAHKALETDIEKMKQYRPKISGVETIQAQYDFFRQLRERMPVEKIYSTKLKGIQSRGKKEERIETLEPLVEGGILRFMRHQRLLLEQLEQFGAGADHDDLPDALQMAVELCGGTRRRNYFNKPAGL